MNMHSCSDPVGTIIAIKNRKVYRIINPNAEEHSLKLLRCGLIDELQTVGLFPKTRIVDPEVVKKLEILRPFCFVLEHELLLQSRPHQWTPNMIAKACQAILSVNKIANKYGYGLKDGHLWNILFKNTNPVFVDFGSFQVLESSSNKFPGFDEFIQASLLPLHFYMHDNSLIGHSLLLDPHYPKGPLSPLSSRIIRHKTYKYLNLQIVLLGGFSIRLPYIRSLHAILARFVNIKTSLSYDKSTRLISDGISSIVPRRQGSVWGSYHDEYQELIPNRFKTIYSEFLRVDPDQRDSVLDLAGNQGFFASKLLANSNARQIIVADSDINALSVGYNREIGRNSQVNFVAVNFIDVIYEQHLVKLLRSDVVFGLALVHHLALSQGLSFHDIARGFHNVVQSRLFVEFMPLGLWAGKQSTAPILPEWYSLDNFVRALESFFDILHKPRNIEDNRVLIVCSPKV